MAAIRAGLEEAARQLPPLHWVIWVEVSQALFIWGASCTHFLIVLPLQGEGSRPTCSLLLQHRERGKRRAGSGRSWVSSWVTPAPSSQLPPQLPLSPTSRLLALRLQEGNRPAQFLLTDLSPNQSSPSWSPARSLEIPSHTRSS